MVPTKIKGDLGQAMVMADVLRRGYKVAIPMGEDWRYDLVVAKNGQLLRVQCKYTEASNGVVLVRCETHDGRNYYKYKQSDLDYLAVYDQVTEKCYYVPSFYLGNGRAKINLRITKAKNGQQKYVLYAANFTKF